MSIKAIQSTKDAFALKISKVLEEIWNNFYRGVLWFIYIALANAFWISLRVVRVCLQQTNYDRFLEDITQVGTNWEPSPSELWDLQLHTGEVRDSQHDWVSFQNRQRLKFTVWRWSGEGSGGAEGKGPWALFLSYSWKCVKILIWLIHRQPHCTPKIPII